MVENRYAVINNANIVENIIIADEGFRLEGKNLINVDNVTCNVGDKYESGIFIPVKIEPVINTPSTEERLEAVELAILNLL